MSLVVVPDAVEFLLQEIKKYGLMPEQVIVEVTEDEMISGFSQFSSAIKNCASPEWGWLLMILVPVMPDCRC